MLANDRRANADAQLIPTRKTLNGERRVLRAVLSFLESEGVLVATG